MKGICGHVQRGTLADLQLDRRRENQVDFEVFQSMERLRN